MADTTVQPDRPLNGHKVRSKMLQGRIRRRRRKWWLVLLPLAFVYPLYLACLALLGVQTVTIDAAPYAVDQGFPYAAYRTLLAERLDEGQVDYAGLHAAPERLRRLAATLAEWGPESAAVSFPEPADRLAYYINAYNILVLLGVVEHWPIGSVHDVRGPFEPEPGFGFFWATRFELDGERVNLYDLEHDTLIDGFRDARLHAVLNCASASCPRLEAEPYQAPILEQQLDAAAQRLASQPPHVVIDDDGQRIVLSALYKWYEDDFRRDAARLELGDGVLDWIRHYAPPELRGRLEHALAAGYELAYARFDWSLNGQ